VPVGVMPCWRICAVDALNNASPSGLSANVRALTTYAALTGSDRHRQAAGEALATAAMLAGRTEVGGRAAAYACRHRVCERPVIDPAELV
jgi:uncharacterized protein YyaL (SSP411 family)